MIFENDNKCYNNVTVYSYTTQKNKIISNNTIYKVGNIEKKDQKPIPKIKSSKKKKIL